MFGSIDTVYARRVHMFQCCFGTRPEIQPMDRSTYIARHSVKWIHIDDWNLRFFIFPTRCSEFSPILTTAQYFGYVQQAMP